MAKPCLIIIFNHRYDKNIPVLRKIYSPRFSHIYFLVPFYNGNDPDVITVYESSHYFQSFFAQGLDRFFKEEYTHYIFTGDDCLLNPSVNENNFLEQTGLPPECDYIPGFIELHTLKNGDWWHTKKAVDFFHNREGAEVQRELPSREEAVERFRKHGVTVEPLTKKNIFGTKKIPFLRWWQSEFYKQFYLRVLWKPYRKNGKIELPYPAVGSYSDVFIVSKESIKDFCRFCGILASIGLFVEIAIPTALLLSSKKIIQEKELKLRGKAMWTAEEVAAVEKTFDNSLARLMKGFPANQLYYHPLKISKWKNDL
jgi:hypothetical protein